VGRLAKQVARDEYGSIQFWFRQKYNLTRTDPRYLEATVQDMLEDFWLHTYAEDPKAVTETVEDDDFDPEAVAAELAAHKRQTTGELPPDDDFEDLNDHGQQT